MNNKSLSQIIELSIISRKYSYSPYSNFAVGAALLTSGNKIFTGTNIECASFSLCICAERVAFTKALSEGVKKFKAIAISSSNKNIYTYPCGACRQFMYEFEKDLQIVIVKSRSDVLIVKLSELIPGAFDKNSLI
ncbi:MAG TPA: cytidine deaminase [Ignavibacteria bacterium]|nr:cytidine deaminase [Ignavibacteria bacterium]